MEVKPSAGEQSGGHELELTRSRELIAQLKEVKKKDEVTYPRIMERIEAAGHSVSLSTLRRVFAEGSEANAASFSYEHVLLPIAGALLNVEDRPIPEDAPNAAQLEGMKAVIRVQNEEIARLLELKEHLEDRVTFLLEQIDKKDRRMDEKDEIIKRLSADKDSLTARLLDMVK